MEARKRGSEEAGGQGESESQRSGERVKRGKGEGKADKLIDRRRGRGEARRLERWEAYGRKVQGTRHKV